MNRILNLLSDFFEVYFNVIFQSTHISTKLSPSSSIFYKNSVSILSPCVLHAASISALIQSALVQFVSFINTVRKQIKEAISLFFDLL
jgi:cytochrome c biogenesis protein CcdA